MRRNKIQDRLDLGFDFILWTEKTVVSEKSTARDSSTLCKCTICTCSTKRDNSKNTLEDLEEEEAEDERAGQDQSNMAQIESPLFLDCALGDEEN